MVWEAMPALSITVHPRCRWGFHLSLTMFKTLLCSKTSQEVAGEWRLAVQAPLLSSLHSRTELQSDSWRGVQHSVLLLYGGYD